MTRLPDAIGTVHSGPTLTRQDEPHPFSPAGVPHKQQQKKKKQKKKKQKKKKKKKKKQKQTQAQAQKTYTPHHTTSRRDPVAAPSLPHFNSAIVIASKTSKTSKTASQIGEEAGGKSSALCIVLKTHISR